MLWVFELILVLRRLKPTAWTFTFTYFDTRNDKKWSGKTLKICYCQNTSGVFLYSIYRLTFRAAGISSVMVSIQCFSNLPLSSIHYGPIPPLIHNYRLLHSMTDSHPQLSTLLPNHQHSASVLTPPLYLLTPLVRTVRVHSTVPGHYVPNSSSGWTIFWLYFKIQQFNEVCWRWLFLI